MSENPYVVWQLESEARENINIISNLLKLRNKSNE
jgi:hypothetical protein